MADHINKQSKQHNTVGSANTWPNNWFQFPETNYWMSDDIKLKTCSHNNAQ